MGTSVALIIFSVSLAAGAVIDCDKKDQSITGLKHPIGDYYNIAITNHHPASDSNSIPQQGDLLPNSQISHHGTNIFIKPHLQFSHGKAPIEQTLIPLYGGNNKLGNALPFVPEYSPEILLTPGELTLPAQHFVVVAPEPQVVSVPQSPIMPAYQEPIERVEKKWPAVIPPAPELPPLQMPTLSLPVLLEDIPMSHEVPVPFAEYLPAPMAVPIPQYPAIQPVVEDAIDVKHKVIPPAPELPPLQLPTLPVPVITEDTALMPGSMVQPIPQSLPELTVVPLPQYPVIQPAIEDVIENVHKKAPLVIPPAPELPPLQLPMLPVPVTLEDISPFQQVPMMPPISQYFPIIEPLPQYPVIQPVIQGSNKENIGFEEKHVGVPVSNIGEYPQYPITYPEAQRELVIQPCLPQMQPAGVIQVHQYINSVPQAFQPLALR